MWCLLICLAVHLLTVVALMVLLFVLRCLGGLLTWICLCLCDSFYVLKLFV